MWLSPLFLWKKCRVQEYSDLSLSFHKYTHDFSWWLSTGDGYISFLRTRVRGDLSGNVMSLRYRVWRSTSG